MHGCIVTNIVAPFADSCPLANLASAFSSA